MPIAVDLTRVAHSDRYVPAVFRSAEVHLLTVNCTLGRQEDMAVTPAIVLAKLQGLSISAEVIDHPAVLTVEVARKFKAFWAWVTSRRKVNVYIALR